MNGHPKGNDAPAARPIARILHLSDLHFGPPVLPAVCEAVSQLAYELEPEVIAISGDLTQRAKWSEFAAARAFIDSLPEAHRIVVPGNHDIPLFRFWERLLRPRAGYREHIHPEPSRVLSLPWARLVGIDSTNPYRAISNGRIARHELQFCEEAFATADDDAWRVVVMHHHLVPAPTFDRARPMPQSQRALERLTEMGVDLVLAGHLHRAYVGNSLDVFAGARRESGIVVVQCGTSTSRRGRGLERESNSVNLVEIYPDFVEVSHYLYLGREPRFSPVSHHRFARPRALSLAAGLSRESTRSSVARTDSDGVSHGRDRNASR